MSTLSHRAPLNPRQLLFVEQYLIDLNGKAAAIRAGYTPSAAPVRAAKLLRRPMVRQAVACAMRERADRTGITAERVIAEYGRIAFSDRRRFTDWRPNHVRFAAMRALTEDERAAVAEIAAGAYGVQRVRLFDKMAALNSLSRIFADAERVRFRPGEAPPDAVLRAEPKGAAPAQPLSQRQRRFADAFLATGNASAAAKRAGYAPKSAPHLATKLRRYPGVAARIEAGFAEKQRAIRIEADRVIEEYARIAFADIGRIADWSDKRLRLKPQRLVARADSAALERIDATSGVKLRVTLYDKVYALDMLARHLGLLDPRLPGRSRERKYPLRRTSAALRARLGQAG